MSTIVVLDATPTGQIVHPKKFLKITAWFARLLASGRRVVLAEVTDYEVRRGLLHMGASRRIRALDEIKSDVYYDPLTTELMLSASQVWADARSMGRAFTADDRLDGDAILVAQAQGMGDRRSVTVITENPKHLDPFVTTSRWQDFEP